MLDVHDQTWKAITLIHVGLQMGKVSRGHTWTVDADKPIISTTAVSEEQRL
jgi:hypothetical protein